METNGKMRTCRGRILALAAAELVVCAATAATTAFYPFDEGAPGTDVASVLNAVDSTLYSGTPSQIASGQMPAYSSDIPGGWIYSDIYRTNLLSSSANSVAFAPADGVSKSGGLLTLANLSTAISAMDEGTVEFFAKSDANQSWRNIVTFNGGQNFKICFDGTRIYWQNFWKYNMPGSFDSSTVSASSGIWFHIAVVWSKANNMASNYLNHVYQHKEFLTNVTTTTSRPFYVGGSGTAGESLYGKVCGLRVSDRILAPDEMLHTSWFPLHDEHILVSLDASDAKKATLLIIDSGSSLKVREGVTLSADRVVYGGIDISAGVYTGIGGASGATQVGWIDGAGTLTVSGVTPEFPSIWINRDGGSWLDAVNWAGGRLPSADRGANVNLSLPMSYTATISSAATAPKTLLIGNPAGCTAAVDVATGGNLDFASGSSVSIERGGVMKLSGGAVSATNTAFNVEAGGVMRVESGVFAFTNATQSAFKVKAGAALDISGGEMHFFGANWLCNLQDNSRLDISGNGKLYVTENAKRNFRCGGNASFSGNAYIYLHHSFFGPDGASSSGEVTFSDNASMGFYSDAVLYVGCSAGSATMNLDSAAKTDVPYGVIIGSTSGSVLNIRNGHWVRGRGNLNVVGYNPNTASIGEVNVYDGAFVQYSSAQYSDCLYGLSVGDGKRSNGTKVRGTLNIFPQGVVSNLVNTSRPPKGAGVYLKVGVGRSAYGRINQLGGSLYHNSNLQCMIGAFGGVGEWNVCSGSVATVLTDVYIGGAVTNELVGFNGVAQPGGTPWNGGENFAKAYNAFAPAKGTLSVEDGTFHTPSNLFAAVVGEGFVSVGPGAGVIEAKNVTLSNTVCEVEGVETTSNATLRVRFGAGTAGCVAVSEKFTVSRGSRLVLDFTDYAKSPRSWFPIVKYAEREGYFADEDISVVGDDPHGSVVKDVTHNGVHGLWYVIPRGTFLIFR
jgi:hypothetical protein